MKKSFVLYTDNYEPIKGLTQEQKGDLLDAIFKYNIDGTEDIDDNFVATVFKFFKIHFKRDKEKWDSIAERNKKNGKLGGRPKKTEQNPEEPKKPSGLFGNPEEPKKAVIGIVNGIGIGIGKNTCAKNCACEICFNRFWDLYNKKRDRKKCFQKWKRLNQDERDKIFETLPAYIESTKDIQFRKDPATYLNNQSWNNEITKGGKDGSNKQDFRDPNYYEDSTANYNPYF
jgi:hypothetical protein